MSASPTPASTSSASSKTLADGQILCKWKDCGLIFDDAETIYKHLCEDHVGRKSTGNLCLQCKWEGCDAASAAKRHHITSHLIVHTPFKPHSCSFCNKTFKRPQDLKKHERIHDTSNRSTKPSGTAATASSLPPKDHSYLHPSYNEMQLQAAQRGSTMYPSHHGINSMGPPQQHPGGYPQVSYPQVKRELTPNYGEASSSASLSPLSSHLGTPGAVNSPVYPNQYPNGGSYGGQSYQQHPQYNSQQHLHHFQPQHQQQQQQQHLYQMSAGSYIGMVPPSSTMKQEVTSQHQPHPNEAYAFLGHGTHHAGSKRGYEEMLVGDFADDVRKKRIQPSYNEDMAHRLNSISQYSSEIDDSTISSLFSDVNPGWSLRGEDVVRSGHENSHGGDLASLNTFLLQLGANVARDLDSKKEEASTSSAASSSSQSQPALSPNSHSSGSSHAASPPDSSSSASVDHHQKPDIHFDLSGLNGIHGFDESLLQGVNWSSSNDSHHDDFYNNNQNFASRPIAHLPSRSHHSQQPMVLNNHGQQGSNYAHSSYPQSGFGGLGSGPSASFDSLRTSRGSALVPQLAQMESVNHNYRKFEALQRAAPMVGSRSSITLPSISGKDGQVDEEMEDGSNKSIRLPPLESSSSSSSRQRSSSPAVSEASSSRTTSSASSPSPLPASQGHGLYPKVTSLGDPSRKLPTPITSSSSFKNGPSISSILASSHVPLSSHLHQRSGSYTTRDTSNVRTASSEVRFRASSEDNASDDTGDSTPLGSHQSHRSRSRSGSYGVESSISPSSKIYPTLPSSTSDNMEVDEVHNEMSNLDLANSKVVLDIETRKRHLNLIRRLLIAINYPQPSPNQDSRNATASSDSDSDSDSSSQTDLAPMQTDSQEISQQNSNRLPSINQLLAGGHRKSSIARSSPHSNHHERLPSWNDKSSSITAGRKDGVDV